VPRPEEPPVHNRVAVFRAEQGLSRRDLAAAVDVHYQTIGYVERGEYRPSLALALRMARFFAVPVEALFSLDPFPRLGGPTPPKEETR
jgi:DNA-binding XRE family transcriptional regulator